MKVENRKKLHLGEYPTPLESMDNLTRKHGKVKLYIKRDDIAGPAFGGNKTRKLEYIMQEALEGGYTAMLTVGGPQTNHGKTTVAAAVKLGLKPILVLGGPAPEYLSGNLTLDAMMGTDIVFAGADMAGAVEATIKRYEAQGDKVYNLPGGGTGTTGVAGYIMAVKEIMDQCEQQGIHPKYVVCAVGSLGTYGGLNIGVRYFNAPFQILGVPVSPKDDWAQWRKDTAKFINDMAAFYEMDIHVDGDELLINNGPADAPYSGEEYNKPDSLTRKAMFELAREEGVITDPTYTGKAFRGFLDMVDKGIIDGDAIFLHTGGATAVWTKEHLDDMQQELFDNCKISEY